jgi:hypothetical protein
LQVQPHVLALQLVVELGGPEHTWAQAPQLLGSFVRFSHAVGEPGGHPVYPEPVLHPQPQALPLHEVVEFAGPAGQTLPQPLQFCGSSVVFTHVLVLVQYVGVDPEQPLTQLVPLHTGVPPEQVTPHPPQLGDVAVLVSQPSSGPPVQWAQPGAQSALVKVQTPPVPQVTVPLTCGRFAQSWPHVPQLVRPSCVQVPMQSR